MNVRPTFTPRTPSLPPQRFAQPAQQPKEADANGDSVLLSGTRPARKWMAAGIEMATIAGTGALIGNFIGGPVLACLGLALGALAGPASALKTFMDERDRRGEGPPKSLCSATFSLGGRQVSVGLRPVAEGPNALALGLAPLAIGDGARSIGVAPTAHGRAAGGFGMFNTEVTGDHSKAYGLYLTTARGEQAKATGPVANLAYGAGARATGLVGNLAFGEGATATGFYFTYAHGTDAGARGLATSLATGERSTASGIAFVRQD